tara:strand:- start:8 stop:160 length:153 start_codon:yes stop_codon:yes gene_type:complete
MPLEALLSLNQLLGPTGQAAKPANLLADTILVAKMSLPASLKILSVLFGQ